MTAQLEMTAQLVSLNCLLSGDNEDQVFTIEIAKNKNVSILKDLIKEEKKPHLDHVDASDLQLWNVSFPIDRLASEEPPADGAGLKPTNKVSSLAILSEEHVHIFVKAPGHVAAPDPTQLLSLNCFVLGDDQNQMFTVKVPKTDNVSILKDLIKEKKAPHLDHVDASDLELWKVSFSINDLDSKEPPTVGPSLKPLRPLSAVFSLAFDPNHIHVVVRVPGAGASLTGSSFPPSSYIYPLRLPEQLAQDRESFCQQWMPLDGGKPQNIFYEMQNGNAYIACNRPTSHASSVPLTLLHPVFGKFLDDCEDHVPTPDDAKLLHEFVEVMAYIHTLESGRKQAIGSLLCTNGIHISPTMIGTHITDGDLSVGESRLLIVEFKNEVGATGNEPYFQAILYYLEATRNLLARHRNSVLPCILVLIFGPYVAFAGAAWTDRPTVQMLSPAIPCHYHDTDIKMKNKLARHLGALRVAIHSLTTYYSEKPSSLHRNPTHPYVMTFKSQDGSVKRFKYVSGMERRNLFFGNLDEDGTAVCIKFATRYCAEAHQFFADMGYAPKLHAVERLPGGLYMVVMDDVSRDYVTLFSLIQDTPDLHSEEYESARLSLTEKIRECLIQLHQAGMVHGDVRNTNIMVKRTGFKDLLFLLVGYDSSGEIRGVRYPLDLNTTTVKRPEGATAGAVVEVDHDLEMVGYIWDD